MSVIATSAPSPVRGLQDEVTSVQRTRAVRRKAKSLLGPDARDERLRRGWTDPHEEFTMTEGDGASVFTDWVRRTRTITELTCSNQLDEPEPWLASACHSLCELDEGRVAAQALVVERNPLTNMRVVRHAAINCRGELPAMLTLLAASRDGFPQDDVGVYALGRFGPGEATCLARRDVVPDDRWSLCGLRKFRKECGVFEFVRAIFPYEIDENAAMVLFELDGTDSDWRPSGELVAVFGEITRSIFDRYHQRFTQRELYRNQLLNLLTPMQQAIAPLLATEMSEPEIALRLRRSRHTIHDHTKAIYKAWRINARAQLRDKWKRPQSVIIPGKDEEEAAVPATGDQ